MSPTTSPWKVANSSGILELLGFIQGWWNIVWLIQIQFLGATMICFNGTGISQTWHIGSCSSSSWNSPLWTLEVFPIFEPALPVRFCESLKIIYCNPTRGIFLVTPLKINLQPKNEGLVQIIFLFKQVIFRFYMNFPGCKIAFCLFSYVLTEKLGLLLFCFWPSFLFRHLSAGRFWEGWVELKNGGWVRDSQNGFFGGIQWPKARGWGLFLGGEGGGCSAKCSKNCMFVITVVFPMDQ